MLIELSYETKGSHMTLDCWGVNQEILDDLDFITKTMKKAIEKCGATYVDMIHKQFKPNGLTVLILLEESHLAYHSYYLESYFSADLYCCGTAEPQVAINYILEKFKPKTYYVKSFERGVE